jgi:hypothetical protein
MEKVKWQDIFNGTGKSEILITWQWIMTVDWPNEKYNNVYRILLVVITTEQTMQIQVYWL